MVIASGGVAGAIGSVFAVLIVFAVVKLISFVIGKSVTKINKDSLLTQDIQDFPKKKRILIGVIVWIVLILISASPFLVIPFLVD